MNYKKHYDLLINRAKNRLLEGYTERHHIIPRCIGGSDDPNNLVDLTPEEHYVAHQLLVKIYPEEKGLLYAAHIMTRKSYKNNYRNNKLYGWLRKKFSETFSGENNNQAKLTKEQVLEIYYSTLPIKELKEKYKCSEISPIKSKEAWKSVVGHLKDPPGIPKGSRRPPLDLVTIEKIFYESLTPKQYKEKYNVGLARVRRIKERKTYKKYTEKFGVPGEIILFGLTETNRNQIINSIENPDSLAKKFKVHPETVRNIRKRGY